MFIENINMCLIKSITKPSCFSLMPLFEIYFTRPIVYLNKILSTFHCDYIVIIKIILLYPLLKVLYSI